LFIYLVWGIRKKNFLLKPPTLHYCPRFYSYRVATPPEVYGEDTVSGLNIDWLTLYVEVDYAFLFELPTMGVPDHMLDQSTICEFGDDLLRYIFKYPLACIY